MDSRALETAKAAGRLLVVTDDSAGGPDHGAREAALRLALEADVAVILYDRTSESWFVDPYPSGNWTAQVDGPDGSRLLGAVEVASMGRGYLADQLREARRLGVEATAWLPKGTGAKQVAECARRFGAGAIVVSDQVTRPTLRDRVRGNTLEKLQKETGLPIVLVHEDGRLEVGGRAMSRVAG